jgi:hypothetical protein
MSKDFDYDDFINEAINKPKEIYIPEWASSNGQALDVFERINYLFSQKLEYIKRKSKAKEFEVKNNWQISKAEVAVSLKPTPQYIFSISPYGKDAAKYLQKKNDNLIKEKEKKFSKPKNGINTRNKDELKTETQRLNKELKLLKNKLADQTLDKILESLPNDLVNKLGL